MSKSDEWQTPQWLFDELHNEFNFDVDLCANENNHKVANYVTDIFTLIPGRPETQVIISHRTNSSYTVNSAFMNPPYSATGKFVEKAISMNFKTLVMLLPVDTSTKWWGLFWDYTNHCPKFIDNNHVVRNNGPVRWKKEIINHIEVRFLPKRIKFVDPETNKETGTPRFASCVVVIRRPHV